LAATELIIRALDLGLIGVVMISLGIVESTISLLNVQDMSKGASPFVARQVNCTASPGLKGTSPKVKGTINGGTEGKNVQI